MEDTEAKLLTVKIDEVKPNEYNPKITEDNKEKYQTILDGIREMGMKSPIDVREVDGDIAYEIIDGFHRWKACKELGWTTIPISSWGKLTDDQAKKITILKEKARIPLDILKTSKMLNELAKDTSLELLARQIGYSLPDLTEDLKVSNFNWGEYDKNSRVNEELGQSSVKTLVVTMNGDQYKVVQEAMAKVKEDSGAEVNDARALELICGDYLAGK